MNSKIDPSIVLSSQTALTIAVIGDRWAFLVIRDVFQGFTQFESLLKRSGAARGTLTSRLKALVHSGILYKHPYQSSPVRYEYRLTHKGMDLSLIVLNAWHWETQWAKGETIPKILYHKNCNQQSTPKTLCKHCNKVVKVTDISYTVGPAIKMAIKQPSRSQRRSKNPDISNKAINQEYFHVLDILGDRWTALVVAAALFGVKRYDDIVSAIGISTNILADRLKLLITMGVIIKRPYQERPVRYNYHLSEKGRDLFNIVLSMHEWGNRWLITKGNEPIILNHTCCNQPLVSKTTCNQCDGILEWSDLSPLPPHNAKCL